MDAAYSCLQFALTVCVCREPMNDSGRLCFRFFVHSRQRRWCSDWVLHPSANSLSDCRSPLFTIGEILQERERHDVVPCSCLTLASICQRFVYFGFLFYPILFLLPLLPLLPCALPLFLVRTLADHLPSLGFVFSHAADTDSVPLSSAIVYSKKHRPVPLNQIQI